MKLAEIKDIINAKHIPKLPIVFKYNDNDFIANQYIEGIKNIENVQLLYIDSLNDIKKIDSFLDTQIIYIYKCKVLDNITPNLDNLIVVTSKIDKKVLTYYNDYIIEIPILEDWQITDFIKTECSGLKDDQINWFLKNYNKDLYKLEQELNKLSIFPPDMQVNLFDDFYRDGLFDINREEVTFQIAVAIQNNDRETLIRLLKEVSQSELEYISLIALMQTNFKKLLKVWLNKTPNEQNTGLKSNQIWAINKLPRIYDRDELLYLFELLSGLDRKIVNGEFPQELTLDYILLKVMR